MLTILTKEKVNASHTQVKSMEVSFIGSYFTKATVLTNLVRCSLAAEALEQLLIQRLVFHGDKELTERCIITLIWCITAFVDIDGGLDSLNKTMDSLRASWSDSLTADATFAALIVSVLFIVACTFN